MEKFGRSQPVKRVEDVRFVTGHGGYVDDVAPEGSLFAHIFRSPVAHGRITALDLDAAREVEGVRLVVSSADLHAAGLTGGLAASQAPNRDGSKGADVRHPLLAEDKLRFVGEAVALIVAETPEAAKDAAELIELDYDDLPVQGFLSPHVADVHENVPGNRAVDYATGDAEGVEAALAASAHVVRAEVADNRVMVVSMEPRGCYAEWQGDRVHLCFGGQGVWGAKKELAGLFGLDEGQVRVTHPDVGGGFGMKAKTYPEYVLCAFAARELGAPVRWTADRTESMLSDNGARDLTHEVALGFDADHRITAYHVKTRYNLGAYNSNFGQMIQTYLFARVLTGVYDIKAALLEAEGFYSNTTQTDAYRGAGRPEAIYLLERAMDYAARDLGLDPWALRRKNFIKGDQFPYATATGESYDVGDFPGSWMPWPRPPTGRALPSGAPPRRPRASCAGKDFVITSSPS